MNSTPWRDRFEFRPGARGTKTERMLALEAKFGLPLEEHVAQLSASGLSDQEIAALYRISVKTLRYLWYRRLPIAKQIVVR